MKGKSKQIDAFHFGKLFIFTDGCFVKKTKAGDKFFFRTKSSYQSIKAIPDGTQFNCAKYQKTAAECDLREDPWSLELDMEVDEVLEFIGFRLPDLAQTMQRDRSPNLLYSDAIDPDYKKFLPPLILLIQSSMQHLAISAGPLEYPETMFA
ncbi:hypothetical protein Moror_16285 [Moniliophthora roreri MCA 2997]|uniref:Uncharacterized protein n=1 Tax=Moniliophthora roreri (strain MCA 2997) TaxID=1381753 RepID=V2W2I1_MONRO|nr:hypothetical protein Moror_16285 [Moniliophthora roreri MCA 2997]